MEATGTPHVIPAGFRAAGVHCGVKTDPQKKDLALFLSDHPSTAAGVFTTNRVVGAPVTVSRARVPGNSTRGVVINSGNANACTGERGIADAQWMTAEIANAVACAPEDILVCSTGIIGHFLPREKLGPGLAHVVTQLGSDALSFEAAARAMMTTDTVHKLASREITTPAGTVRLLGAAKGAAMIAPNMATMLAVILTDARLPSALATTMLRTAVDDSFNCISVDGHMSTSDTVLLLANGASGVDASIAQRSLETALAEVCQELAQAIIRDAEGAGHFVTLDVRGLATRDDARRIATAVCESPLVKTAITGNDPNWGRIVSAAGYAGVPFEEHHCSLKLNGVTLYENGTPVTFDEPLVSQSMATGEVHIELDFTLGSEAIRMWTSDLTGEYVHLNSDYTT